jgi:hypothetical protein
VPQGSASQALNARVKAALSEMPRHMAADGWTEDQAQAWAAYLVEHGACTRREAEALLDAYQRQRRGKPLAPIVDLASRRARSEEEQEEQADV